MPKSKVRVDSVPEGAQAVVARAKADLVERTGMDPDAIAVTRLEPVQSPTVGPAMLAVTGFPDERGPNYRIYLLAKGIQYVYHTEPGGRLVFDEQKFVV